MMSNKFGTLIISALLIGLAGCGNDQKVSLVGQTPLSSAERSELTLTPSQVELYQKGLKDYLGGTGTLSFAGVQALSYQDNPGVHICGYVTYAKSDGAKSEKPFYVELRADEGKETVYRGQVGADEAKLSKVKFVCRYHF